MNCSCARIAARCMTSATRPKNAAAKELSNALAVTETMAPAPSAITPSRSPGTARHATRSSRLISSSRLRPRWMRPSRACMDGRDLAARLLYFVASLSDEYPAPARPALLLRPCQQGMPVDAPCDQRALPLRLGGPDRHVTGRPGCMAAG